MNKFARFLLTAVLVLAAGRSYPAKAQSVKAAKGTSANARAGDQGSIERGKYIVESVAMCSRCHTPRKNGVEESDQFLMGAPIQPDPTYPSWDYALRAPRIAGTPPETDSQFITMVTTGIARTGKPPLAPMPEFHMTRQDAESVLAFLKSLRR